MNNEQSINRKEVKAFVDFFIEEARRIVHLAESTLHFSCFPDTEIYCDGYFEKQVDELISQAYNESVPSPVTSSLQEMLIDVGYYVTCCQFHGVGPRMLNSNPRLEYFHIDYEVYDNPETRQHLFNGEYTPHVIFTDERLAKRNEYLSRIRQEFEEAGVEFSVEKAFYKEANDTFDLIISKMRNKINALLRRNQNSK